MAVNSSSVVQRIDDKLLPGVNSGGKFSVFVGKEDFKFHAAHFVAFRGYRERLHGHNYQVSVQLDGELREDGYVVDFGDVKKATRKICKELNEHFLCPCHSDVLNIQREGSQVCIHCPDGAFFSFPRTDCFLLPIVHSTAEELGVYIWKRLVESFGTLLRSRGVTTMEVTVSEAARQQASFRHALPSSPEDEMPHLLPLPRRLDDQGKPVLASCCPEFSVRPEDKTKGEPGGDETLLPLASKESEREESQQDRQRDQPAKRVRRSGPGE